MDLTRSADALLGWSPIRMEWRDGRPVVDWCHTEGVAFEDPFFDQTVEACFRDPFRLLFRRNTGIEEVGRFVADHPGLPPAGFVFHMSRCGSTLAAQMLGSVPEHLVVSEAGPLDWVLRAPTAERVDWLRWMVGALGQARDSRQRRMFVKFDAWSALELPVVRAAFPDVPWLFLFRDPLEVLVSHARRRGAHMIPGVLPPVQVGLSPAEISGIEITEYGARVLAGICEAALALADDPLSTFADYRRLPELVTTDLAAAWSLPLGSDAVAAMVSVAANDAKNPVLPFTPDGEAKRAEASPELRAAAARWLDPLYERLRELEASGAQ